MIFPLFKSFLFFWPNIYHNYSMCISYRPFISYLFLSEVYKEFLVSRFQRITECRMKKALANTKDLILVYLLIIKLSSLPSSSMMANAIFVNTSNYRWYIHCVRIPPYNTEYGHYSRSDSKYLWYIFRTFQLSWFIRRKTFSIHKVQFSLPSFWLILFNMF